MMYCIKYDNIKDNEKALNDLSKLSWYNELVFILTDEDDLNNHKSIEMTLRSKYKIRHPRTTSIPAGNILESEEDICNILNTI